MNIQYTKEGKQIIDAIDELTSWDKGELISYLIYKLSSDELDKYLIENTDYIHADDIDYVRGVVDSNLMTEVLDEMDDYDILDYILNSFDGYGKPCRCGGTAGTARGEPTVAVAQGQRGCAVQLSSVRCGHALA